MVVWADNPAHKSRTAVSTIQNRTGAQRLICDFNIPSPSSKKFSFAAPKHKQNIDVKQDAALDERSRCGDARENKTPTPGIAIHEQTLPARSQFLEGGAMDTP